MKQPAAFFKVEKDVLLAQLSNKEDQTKVLKEGPWSLEGDAIILQKWEHGMTGEDFINTKINIWVHIHGLPFELRRPEFAERFAAYAGRVQTITKKDTKKPISYEGEYMRFHIALDTGKPILPGMFLKRTGRKPVWVSLKYERLPHVCYHCGRLNHDTKVCKVKNKHLDSNYGGWLKAEDNTKRVLRWTDVVPEEHLVVEMSPETAKRNPPTEPVVESTPQLM